MQLRGVATPMISANKPFHHHHHHRVHLFVYKGIIELIYIKINASHN